LAVQIDVEDKLVESDRGSSRASADHRVPHRRTELRECDDPVW
jgi:hypothetical protein